MSQGFVFGTPANQSDLESLKVRVNMDALGTSNALATAPAAPREGMPWLDTSQAPTQWQFKMFLAGAFQALITFPSPATDALAAQFVISPASVTWTLQHNLNRNVVAVALYDVNDKLLDALDVDVSDPNKAVVTHASAVEGAAVVIG